MDDINRFEIVDKSISINVFNKHLIVVNKKPNKR